MVLGSTRERSIVGAHEDTPDVPPSARLDDWRTARGAVRWEGGADLAGGFPGFATRGGRLVGVQFRLTDHFIVVDEGRPHGFGLPLGWLLGADLLAPPRAERADPTLRLRYHDGLEIRTFQVRFRGSLLAPRGGRRAEQVLVALHALGLTAAGEPLPAAPEFAVSWEEAARFEGENVIWSGQASALVGRGGERAACDVWLTTRSVIWGSSAGSGILRLALEAVVDAVPADLADRPATPVVYVAAADDHGGRHELPFVFDRQSPVQRSVRERGAFVVGLRSRGVPLGTAPPSPQPWRDAVVPQAPLPPVAPPAAANGAGPGRGDARLHPRRPVPTGRFQPRPFPADDSAAPGRWERAMAEWTGRPTWPEPASDGGPQDPQPSAPERFHQPMDGHAADAATSEEAGDRPPRGILVPWPGTQRAERAATDRVHDEREASPPALGDGSPSFAAPAAATHAPPSVTHDPHPVTPAYDPAAGEPAPIASFPAVGSWPVPAGFLGPVAIGGASGVEDKLAPPEPAIAASAGDAPPSAQSAAAVSVAADPVAAAPGQRPPDEGAVRSTGGPAPSSPADDPRGALRRYEAALLRAITGVLRAIEDNAAWDDGSAAPPPSPAERAAAFAALDALAAGGELSVERAEVHRAMLVAAGEAGPRLRSLLELRAAGYLADADLDRKYRQIVAPIAALLTR